MSAFVRFHLRSLIVIVWRGNEEALEEPLQLLVEQPHLAGTILRWCARKFTPIQECQPTALYVIERPLTDECSCFFSLIIIHHERSLDGRKQTISIHWLPFAIFVRKAGNRFSTFENYRNFPTSGTATSANCEFRKFVSSVGDDWNVNETVSNGFFLCFSKCAVISVKPRIMPFRPVTTHEWSNSQRSHCGEQTNRSAIITHTMMPSVNAPQRLYFSFCFIFFTIFFSFVCWKAFISKHRFFNSFWCNQRNYVNKKTIGKMCATKWISINQPSNGTRD